MQTSTVECCGAIDKTLMYLKNIQYNTAYLKMRRRKVTQLLPEKHLQVFHRDILRGTNVLSFQSFYYRLLRMTS